MKTLCIMLLSALFLSACAGIELQEDGTGTDRMKASPCACLPVEYAPARFEWGAPA